MEQWEKKIASQYYQTYRKLRKKFEDDTRDIATKDKKLLQDVKDGKITKDEYFAWRVKVNLKLQKQAKKMAELLDKADEDAKDIANNEMPKKYTQSYNKQGYDTEKALSIETDFEVQNVEAIQQAIAGRFYAKYDKAANDRYNRRRLSSMITAGIIQGKSMQDIAKDIRPLCDSNRKSAIRNARTWVTGAENGGRHDAALRMKELGVKERKIWLAVTDMRTRFSHRALDEEIKEIDEPFSNGGMYPADPKLPPEERYNCRCRYRVLPDGFNPDMNVRHVDIGGMSYDEWKQGKKRKQKAKQQVKQPQQVTPQKQTNTYVLTAKEKQAYQMAKHDAIADGVSARKVEDLKGNYTEKDIIDRIAGADKTKGSCASLAICYVANKLGLDVIDFRGGRSQSEFSKKYFNEKVFQSAGASYKRFEVAKEVSETAKILRNNVEPNKEYVLSAGRHMACVRLKEDSDGTQDWQYLELQAPRHNGWTSMSRLGSIENTLYYRFGCTKSQRTQYGVKLKTKTKLYDIDSCKATDEFRDMLSYLNTDPKKQQKGAGGGTK